MEREKSWELPPEKLRIGWLSLLCECGDEVWEDNPWLNAELGSALLEQKEQDE